MRTFLPRLGPRLQFEAAAALAVILASGIAEASVISPTPTLPPADGVYVGTASPGCFTTLGVCVGPGTFSITSVISSTFDASGQELMLDGVYSSAITDLSHAPIGTLTLTGEADESVSGRLGPTDTGTWTTGLDALDLSGTVLGDAVSVGLDPSNPTTGETSITPMGPNFLITSSFDAFVDVTIDTAGGPLTAPLGPLTVNLVPVPEPSTLGLLGISIACVFFLSRSAMTLAWRRGRARSVPAGGIRSESALDRRR